VRLPAWPEALVVLVGLAPLPAWPVVLAAPVGLVH